MKVIYTSYKFKITPDPEQKVLMAKHFGACRFLLNRYLHSRSEAYRVENKSLNYYDNANDLTRLKKEEGFDWLREINSQSLQSALAHLNTAYTQFFQKKSKFPRFKSRYDHQRFTVPQSVSIENGKSASPNSKTESRLPSTGK